MNKRWLGPLGVLFFLCALVLPQAAAAHVGDLFGLNARAIALANAHTALAEGPVAAFYNPAALAARPGVAVEIGYQYSLPGFDLSLKAVDGTKLEEGEQIKKAEEQLGYQFLATGISGRIADYVGLGFYMNLPVSGVPQDRFFHPQTPYWLRYETGLQGFQIYPGLAVQIVPGVMLGVGATINLDGGGDVEMTLPIAVEGGDAEPTLGILTGQSKWTAGVSLNAGAFYRPFEFLQFGLTYRGENFLKNDQTFTLFPFGREGAPSLPVNAEITTDYSPHQLALGAAGRPFEWWTITADLVYSFWSRYRAPFPKLTPDFTRLVDEEGNPIPVVSPVLIEVKNKDLNFADTLVVRTGMEFRPIQNLGVLVGYAFEPTPVPDQTGTTNILDSDTHVVGFGFGVNVGGEDNDLVRIDVAGQYHFIREREIEKDPAEMDPFYGASAENLALNPTYPRTDVSAGYFLSGISVRFRF